MPLGIRLAIGVPIAALIITAALFIWYKRRESVHVGTPRKLNDSVNMDKREEMYVKETVGCGRNQGLFGCGACCVYGCVLCTCMYCYIYACIDMRF